MQRVLCIVLLNYKNDQDTVDCVNSVKDSALIELPYLVVVDNGLNSRELKDKLGFYPDLQILSPENNLGFGRGINFGIHWALENIEFTFLLILNNDVLVERSALQKLIDCAYRNKDISYFTPCIVTLDRPPRVWYAGGELIQNRMTAMVYNIGSEYVENRLESQLTSFASGCALLISKEKLDKNAPLFDPEFFMYDEDIEFSLRLNLSGEKIFFVGNAVIYHKCQGSQVENTSRKLNQLSPGNKNLNFYLKNTIRNRYYIVDKHIKGFDRIKTNVALSVYWLMKSIQYFLYLNFRSGFVVLREMTGYIRNKINSR